MTVRRGSILGGEYLAIEAPVATTHTAGGDYATIVLIRDGQPTPELLAIKEALERAA